MPDGPSNVTRRARVAVAALFFANGALFANLVPRFPDLKAGLTLSNAAFGTAIAAYGLGALIIGLGGGALVSRFGSARVAPASTVAIAANLVLLGLAPSWATLAAALFVAGALDAIADVGGNAHGLRVERRYGRSILNSLHGVWSIGAVVGGAMGTAAAALRIPLPWHLAAAAVVFAIVAALAYRYTLPGPDDVPEPAIADPATGPHRYEHRRPGRRRSGRRRSGRWAIGARLVALAGVGGMAQGMEDVGATWSAVYLREDLGAVAAVSGLAFIALQSAQTLGRLIGDRVVTRFGDRAVARAGALIAGGSMAAALAVATPTTTVIAFGLVGFSIGTLIPAGLRTADALPGLPRGFGLTAVQSGTRVIALVLPPVIGLVADAAGLRIGLLAVPLAALVVLACAVALPRRP